MSVHNQYAALSPKNRQIVDKAVTFLVEHPERGNEFIAFLHFCAERLERGEDVKEIWDEYKGSHKI